VSLYDAARKELTPHRREELLMRRVERGAIDHGRQQQHALWVAELRAKGWTDLADYFGKLLNPKPQEPTK